MSDVLNFTNVKNRYWQFSDYFFFNFCSFLLFYVSLFSYPCPSLLFICGQSCELMCIQQYKFLCKQASRQHVVGIIHLNDFSPLSIFWILFLWTLDLEYTAYNAVTRNYLYIKDNHFIRDFIFFILLTDWLSEHTHT